jgi:collagenase-like PrtC family protease
MTQLTLGPLLFNWPAETVRDFYFRIADEAPVDSVHLGEVVCAKRAPFVLPYLPAMIERLEAAGKEVVLSTPILPADQRELRLAEELVATGRLIEANDITVAAWLSGRPHVIGPTVNVYNELTLRHLERRGARRVALPTELPAAAIGTLAAQATAEIEVFAFGRLPLAISARCYHARAHGLHKDGCRFVCDEDADGMPVETLDAQGFLCINGTQTLSHACHALLRELPDLVTRGVGRFRLSPHACDMVAVARLYRDLLDGALASAEAEARLRRLVPAMPLANGYVHGVEGFRWVAAS